MEFYYQRDLSNRHGQSGYGVFLLLQKGNLVVLKAHNSLIKRWPNKKAVISQPVDWLGGEEHRKFVRGSLVLKSLNLYLKDNQLNQRWGVPKLLEANDYWRVLEYIDTQELQSPKLVKRNWVRKRTDLALEAIELLSNHIRTSPLLTENSGLWDVRQPRYGLSTAIDQLDRIGYNLAEIEAFCKRSEPIVNQSNQSPVELQPSDTTYYNIIGDREGRQYIFDVDEFKQDIPYSVQASLPWIHSHNQHLIYASMEGLIARYGRDEQLYRTLVAEGTFRLARRLESLAETKCLSHNKKNFHKRLTRSTLAILNWIMENERAFLRKNSPLQGFSPHRGC